MRIEKALSVEKRKTSLRVNKNKISFLVKLGPCERRDGLCCREQVKELISARSRFLLNVFITRDALEYLLVINMNSPAVSGYAPCTKPVYEFANQRKVHDLATSFFSSENIIPRESVFRNYNSLLDEKYVKNYKNGKIFMKKLCFCHNQDKI